MASQREIGICSYCGEEKELGDLDRMVPRCLFEHKNQSKPIVESLLYVVHGLHVIQTGQLLPLGTPVDVLISPPEQYRPTLQRLGPLMNRGVYGLEPGTITWAGHEREEPPDTAIWLLESFQSVLIVGLVGVARPPGPNPQRYAASCQPHSSHSGHYRPHRCA